MYESSHGTVHLQVESDGTQVEILGQFLPADGAPVAATVHLVAGGKAFAVELEETGEFAFSSLPADRIEIQIRTGDYLLSLAPLDPMLG
jgi:hypothetical protein